MAKFLVKPKHFLLVVDTTKAFMPGGGLAITDGDQIVSVIARLGQLFRPDQVLFTWEPHRKGCIEFADSLVGVSDFAELDNLEVRSWTGNPAFYIKPYALFNLEEFKLYMGIRKKETFWPIHSLETEEESRVHEDLIHLSSLPHWAKGHDPKCPSLDPFFDNLGRPTGLHPYLQLFQATDLVVVGLALDVCAGLAALTAAKLGYKVTFILNASKSVTPAGEAKMLAAMKAEPNITLITF